MTPQVEMLLECTCIMEEDGKYTPLEAFARLVDWTAVQASVPSGVVGCGIAGPKVKVETAEALDRTLDLGLLQLAVADHFRQAAVELGLLQPDPPKEVMVIQGEGVRPAILDPWAGSGTYLLELFDQHGRAYTYYGATADQLEYRMALLNMHLFGVPALILLATGGVHDLSLDSPNWKYANIWYRSHDRNLLRGGSAVG